MQMQLANKPLLEIESLDYYVNRAKYLVHYIDNPTSNMDSKAFAELVETYQSSFPHFSAAFVALDTRLHKMSQETRLELKLTLLTDVRTIVERIQADLRRTKLLEGEALPADPDECMRMLDLLMDSGLAQIRAVHRTFQHIEHARALVTKMQDNKRQIAQYEETPFTSLPNEREGAGKSAAKKAKVDG